MLKEGMQMSQLSEKALENKKRYSMEYAKKHYKRIPLDVTQEMYDQIKAAVANSEDKKETVNGLIKKAIKQYIGIDK